MIRVDAPHAMMESGSCRSWVKRGSISIWGLREAQASKHLTWVPDNAARQCMPAAASIDIFIAVIDPQVLGEGTAYRTASIA